MNELTNKLYVEARMKLIPKAEALAGSRLRKKYGDRYVKTIPRTDRDRAFMRAMTELAVEEGLINKGNLVLMNAEDLPSGYGRLNK